MPLVAGEVRRVERHVPGARLHVAAARLEAACDARAVPTPSLVINTGAIETPGEFWRFECEVTHLETVGVINTPWGSWGENHCFHGLFEILVVLLCKVHVLETAGVINTPEACHMKSAVSMLEMVC